MKEWKELNKYSVLVSDCGDIIGVRGGLLKQYVRNRKTSYLAVKLKGKNVYIHDLVTEAFIGEKPKGLEVRHLNDNKIDNRLCNLKYGTRKENHNDSVRNCIAVNPPRHHGENHPMAKLTFKDILSIKKEYKKGKVTQTTIAKKYNIGQPAVSSIVLNKTWCYENK